LPFDKPVQSGVEELRANGIRIGTCRADGCMPFDRPVRRSVERLRANGIRVGWFGTRSGN